MDRDVEETTCSKSVDIEFDSETFTGPESEVSGQESLAF